MTKVLASIGGASEHKNCKPAAMAGWTVDQRVLPGLRAASAEATRDDGNGEKTAAGLLFGSAATSTVRVGTANSHTHSKCSTPWNDLGCCQRVRTTH
jgi:hypothetical protein